MSDLAAPPRALTEPMRKYLDTETSNLFGLWVACAVLFTIGHFVVVGASGSWTMPPIMPAFFVVLAVVSALRRASHRRRMTRVLTEGVVTGALVREVRQVEKRSLVTIYATYRVDGADGDITIASIEPAFARLQAGQRDEVLVLPTEPDIIIPTFVLA